MQGGVGISMVIYGIGVLLLIKHLKAAYTDITQSCYIYNVSALGTFDNIGLYLKKLRQFGPICGCYPKYFKSILILHPDNLVAGKEFCLCHEFKVCTGMHYLGDFIGYN